MSAIDRLAEPRNVRRLVVGFVVAVAIGTIGMSVAVVALLRDAQTRNRIEVIEAPPTPRAFSGRLDVAIANLSERQARALLAVLLDNATDEQLARLRPSRARLRAHARKSVRAYCKSIGGCKGDRGERGRTGQGRRGADGRRGARGERGIAGRDGGRGPQGLPGMQGPPGMAPTPAAVADELCSRATVIVQRLICGRR